MTADGTPDPEVTEDGGWLDPTAIDARRLAGSVTLVDIRGPAGFAAGHPAGALCVPYDPHRLATRIAAFTDDRPVVIVADDGALAADAIRQLTAAGQQVAGVLDAAAWRDAGRAWSSLPELTANALLEEGVGNVLDVREPAEWLTGCVPGALRIPLGELPGRLDEVPRETAVAVMCESGMRSATAASVLHADGWHAPANVTDGMAGYRRSDGPLDYPITVEDLNG